MNTTRSVLLATAVALLGLAAPAVADETTTDYRVDFDVSVHYSHHAKPTNYDGQIEAGFSYSGSLPKVTFRDGSMFDTERNAAAPHVKLSNIDATLDATYYGARRHARP